MEKERINLESYKRRFPEIPEYSGKIDFFRGIPIHMDKFFWSFKNQKDGSVKDIPVFSVWNYDHHPEIAELMASGKVVAWYSWGTYSVGMVLNSPEWGRSEDAVDKLRTKLKKGRPWGQKFANLIHPDDMIDFWDIDRLHPNFKKLQWASNRYRLYQLGPVHIIAPVKKRNPHLHQALVTDYDDTASFFYMPHPAWDRIVSFLRKSVKHGVFGGGSLNFHQEDPGFTTTTLYKMISETPEWQENIDLVVVDEIAEWARVNRSQTQIRLPQKGSDGVCEIVRYGGLSPRRWSEFTGFPVKEASEGVKFASSQLGYTPVYNDLVDELIAESKKLMEIYHKEKTV